MNALLTVNLILLWFLVLANILLTLVLVRRVNELRLQNTMPEHIKLDIGTTAPEFTAETVDGETVTHETYSQRNVVMVFVSSTCSPCREKIPEFKKLYSDAKNVGVDLVLVGTDEKAATKALVDEFDITLPVLVAPAHANPLMENYRVGGTPYYCYIESGIVKATGFLDNGWQAIISSWQ